MEVPFKDTYGDQSVRFACRYRSLKDWNTFYTYMYVIFIESRYLIVCHLLSVSIMITNLELLFCYLGKYPGDRRRIWRNKNFRHWKGAVCSDIGRTCKQVNNQTSRRASLSRIASRWKGEGVGGGGGGAAGGVGEAKRRMTFQTLWNIKITT